MHILFLTHYYPPESNAPANRVSELAHTWVADGHQVTVVTCTPNHPGGRPFPPYRNEAWSEETLNGVRVIRVGTYLAPNQGIARRTVNFLSYLAAVTLFVWRFPKADVVVSTSPQFFAGLAGFVVACWQRRPWVLEVRDIWPESVAAVGAMKKGLILRAVEAVERWAYRTADQVVVVSRAFIPHIVERASVRRPLEVIENGVNLELFADDAPETDLRRELGLDGKTVFGYVGTHGMAHALQTVVQAAALTRNEPHIGWLMVGSGAEREHLLSLKAEAGLDNLVMLDHRPRADMPTIWACTDVSLVHLRASPLFHRVIPSKMFEAMAMRRPIILGVDGEARRILDESGSGVFVEPETPQALADAARRLAADPSLRRRLGESGRAHVAARYDRAALARRYMDILKAVVSERLA